MSFSALNKTIKISSSSGQGRLNLSWSRSALLLLIFYELFEDAANKDPGKVEDDGSAEGEEDRGDGGAVVLFVSLLDEQDKGLEVARAKSNEVDHHPRN